MYYIAIDIGSTSIKTAVLDLMRGEIVQVCKVPCPPNMCPENSGRYEISAAALLTLLKRQIDSLAAVYQGACGVVFSTQMHGFVYATPGREDVYISWQDMRCLKIMRDSENSYLEHLEGFFGREEMEACGVYLKPSLGLCNLYALLHEDPSLSRAGELFTLGSYMIRGLTGHNICHMTNAAPLGFVDVPKKQWNRAILDKAGLGDMRLPEIAAGDFTVCGYYHSHGQRLKIYPDFGDQQTAILGCMGGSGAAVVNIATAAQVSKATAAFIPGVYEIRPYFEGRYLNTISNMPAGRGLEVLLHFIKATLWEFTGQVFDNGALWDKIMAMPTTQENELRVNMDFYAAPQRLAGGSIAGITHENLSVGNLFAAAYEEMAKTYWDNMLRLADGAAVEEIICAGGVAWKRPELIAAIQRASAKKCRLSARPDEVLVGLFRIALVCENLCQNLGEQPHRVPTVMEGSKNDGM